MQLNLFRVRFHDTWVGGQLYIGQDFFCFTMEPIGQYGSGDRIIQRWPDQLVPGFVLHRKGIIEPRSVRSAKTQLRMLIKNAQDKGEKVKLTVQDIK
jgi:hypothetical protein